MAGVVYYFFGLETKGKSIDQIDRELGGRRLTSQEDCLGHADPVFR